MVGTAAVTLRLVGIARQRDDEFCKCTGLGVDPDGVTMLFHNDIVTYGEAKSGAFAGVVKNGLNIFSFISEGIPAPLSRIRISTESPRLFVAASSVGSNPASPSLLRLVAA